ncbi:MAG: hypothetical protein GX275_11510 [Clostridiales bacterium]|nr:hypothetical protein [Clostridiales bacterium]
MKKIITLLFTLFFIIIMSTIVYGFFYENEKILPSELNGVPVYDEFTIEYSDHSEDRILDDGVTIYFDVSSLLPTWNSPTFYYYVTNSSGTVIRNNGWAYTVQKRMKYDSVRTVNPTDLSKVSTVTNNGGTLSYYSGLGGITWSGTWVKINVNDPLFDISSSENRNVIIHVGNDQTANNIKISKGVKEVYIKGAEVKNTTTGSSSYNWSKLEIKY